MSVVSYSFLLAFFPLALILFRVLKGPSRQVWLLLTGLLFCAWEVRKFPMMLMQTCWIPCFAANKNHGQIQTISKNKVDFISRPCFSPCL